MTRQSVAQELHRDDGMTLIELMVYSAVSALFLALLASISVASWRADAATRDRDAATGAVHVITNSIQTSIRNSSGFKIDGGLLRARVATGVGDWECRAWRLSNPRKIGGKKWYELQYNHGDDAISDASAGWSNLLEDLNGGTGHSLLVQGNPTADKPFGEQGQLLTLNLKIAVVDLSHPALDGELVSVSGDTLSQAKEEGGSTTCW